MSNCPICNTPLRTTLFCQVEGYDHMQCQNCQVIYVPKPPTTAELYQSYDYGSSLRQWIRKIVYAVRPFQSIGRFEESMQRSGKIFDFIKTKTSITKTISYLDIGCNRGFLLAQAVKQGWNINGIEIVPSLTQPFKRAYPTFAHQIHAGRFTDLHQNFPDESLDVISAIDVIEHLEDPFFELSQIYRILKKGGSFVAQTPDGACKKAQEGKEKWGGFKPYEHLFLFSALNLEMLAKRIGFQEVSFYQPFEMMDENFVAVFKK